MMKRCMDIILSGMALLVFLPFGLFIALVLRFTGEGEIFYFQSRIGKGEQTFNLIKFATMLKDSPTLGPGLLTLRGDPRVLPVGRFLRMTKLNEMPQLINILKGDMSIIGPRPQVPGKYDFLSQEKRDVIYSIHPGLSCISGIVFRDEEGMLSQSPKGADRYYKEDIMPLKAELEIWYVKHVSLRLDCLIILATIWAILVPETKVFRTILGKEWDDALNKVYGGSIRL